MSAGRLTIEIVGIALVGALAMSGCSLVDQEVQDKLWSESTFTPTAVGTATGAVIGGGIGAVIGAQSGNPVGGIAIGATAGMAAGAAIGYNLEDNERKAAEFEERGQREEERFESNRRRIEAIKQNKDRIAAAERDARATFSPNKYPAPKAAAGYDRGPDATRSAGQVNSSKREWIVPRSSDLARSGSAATTRPQVHGLAANGQAATAAPGISPALPRPQAELPTASNAHLAGGTRIDTGGSPAVNSSGLPAAKSDSGLPPAAVERDVSKSSVEENPPEALTDGLEIEENVDDVASEAESASVPLETSSRPGEASRSDAPTLIGKSPIKIAAPVRPAIEKDTRTVRDSPSPQGVEAVASAETNEIPFEIKSKETVPARSGIGKQSADAKSEMIAAAAGSTDREGGNDCERADEEALRAKNSASEADQLFYFRRAIRLCPGEPRYHIQIGQVYAAIGRTEDAEGAFKKALELDPKSDDAKRQLSLIDDSKQKY